MFLVFLSIMLAFALVQIIISFATINAKEQVARLVLNIILALLILPSIAFVYTLLGFHTYLTKGNITTN